jgi:uncharacterized damage-inducible protein DinB
MAYNIEPWLRGPVAGIPALLQPAAHAFLMAREDVDAAIEGLTHEQFWLMPGRVASIGYHLAHLAGSTDRLFTYARGEELSLAQRAELTAEGLLCEQCPEVAVVVDRWHRAVDHALSHLAAVDPDTLLEPRSVGRKKLPSTVFGLLFHAAEHASRHTGQVVTTAKLIRARNG